VQPTQTRQWQLCRRSSCTARRSDAARHWTQVRASPVQPTPPAAETRWPRKLLAAEGTLGSLEVELLHRRMDRTSRTSRRCYSSDARGPFIPYGDSHKPRCPFRPSRHLAPAAGPASPLAPTCTSRGARSIPRGDSQFRHVARRGACRGASPRSESARGARHARHGLVGPSLCMCRSVLC